MATAPLTVARIQTAIGSMTTGRSDSDWTRCPPTPTGMASVTAPRTPTMMGSRTQANAATAPTHAMPDSDDDGIDDWHEDSNHDGVPDGLTQDAVPVPAGLRPPLADPNDRPRSWYSCHQGRGHTAPKVCVLGARGPRVLVFGDSHALQWRAPLERVATHLGWRLYFLTKSACPVARIALPAADCAEWRTRALARITAIHPDMIIASELNSYPVLGATGPDDQARLWRTGLRATLKALHRMTPKLVLLGDTPHWMDAATCLPEHLDDVSACAQRRSVASGSARIANDRAAAQLPGRRM